MLHPFATSRQLGTGDALWYTHMLADFLSQWRAGIFPVFAGQTPFAFNGAVYPLRVAPLYQHLAGALDLLTARQLGWFALQHLCVIVMGVAGLFSCYFSLCALSSSRSLSPSPSPSPSASLPRWSATGLSILYLSCPGVLGAIYTEDLYMSWMTVPFLPLVFYGNVRTFQRNDLRAQLWLVASLALLWWAHAPIALWATLLSMGLQAVRLSMVHRDLPSWKRAAGGALLFLALAHYPFVSVATLNVPGAASTVTAGLAHPEVIVNSIRQAFPGILLPVSRHAGALSDLQLGYGLWLVLIVGLAALRWIRSWELRLVLAGAALLLLLLLPVPGLNAWLWQHVPESIKRITYYWPMQRFYLLLAALLVVAGQLTLPAWVARKNRGGFVAAFLLVVGCTWSLWESRQFIRAGRERTASAATSTRNLRPENLPLMNHAYGLFSALPPYFSHGVMDPRSETRLLDRETLKPVTKETAHPAETGRLQGTVDANPGILDLAPPLRLEFGHRYDLDLEFSAQTYDGVLQLQGHSFFREYSLPSSGEAQAFGSGRTNSGHLSLWTTDPAGDEVALRFIPSPGTAKPAEIATFANYHWREVDPSDEPEEVTSLLPFRVETRSTAAGWLETPRMFISGYRATVDGRPHEVKNSPQWLAMIPVEAGNHRVELRYVGPLVLRISYWFSLAAWTALLAGGGMIALRRKSAEGTAIANLDPSPSREDIR